MGEWYDNFEDQPKKLLMVICEKWKECNKLLKCYHKVPHEYVEDYCEQDFHTPCADDRYRVKCVLITDKELEFFKKLDKYNE